MLENPERDETAEAMPAATEIDIDSLSKALATEKEKTATYLANWQRAQADFTNYKRRTEQECQETSRFANTTLLLSILPALDDFERALSFVPSEFTGQPWVDGIRLIVRKIHTSLESQGLSPIKALGEPFDPRLHEAAAQREGEEGMVVGELKKGYKLFDRVIRPTTVVVGNGAAVEKKEEG